MNGPPNHEPHTLTDDQVRALWAAIRHTPPPTWRDQIRYHLTWRPRWALRLWRRITR